MSGCVRAHDAGIEDEGESVVLQRRSGRGEKVYYVIGVDHAKQLIGTHSKSLLP